MVRNEALSETQAQHMDKPRTRFFTTRTADSAAPAQMLKLGALNAGDGAHFTDTKLRFTTRLGLSAVSSQGTLTGRT